MIMKQKFAILGLCYIVATISASFFCANIYITVFIVVGIILAVAFLSVVDTKNSGKYALFGIVIVVAVGSFSFRYNKAIEGVKPLYGGTYEVNGVVTDVYSRESGYNSISVYLPQKFNNYLPFDMTIQLNTYEYINVGEYINSNVMFGKVQQNENRFEYNRTFSKKVYIKSLLYKEVNDGIRFGKPFTQTIKIFFATLKERISEKIDFYINEKEAGVFKSLIIGDKSDMDYGVGLDFSYTGLAHILAISGLHISIVSGMLKRFFNRFYIHAFASNIITIILVWGFVILTGVSNSTVRAAIMVTISLLAYNLGEYSDSINSLAVSVVLILIINPFAIFDMGLTLSVISTIGVIVSSRWIIKIMEKFETDYKIFRIEKARFVVKSIVMTVGAITFLMPFYVLVFRQLNVLVIIANLVVTPIVELIVGFGFVFILLVVPFTMNLDIVYSVLGQVINTLCEVLLYIVEWIAKIPYMTIPFRSEISIIWLVTFVIAIIYILVKKIPLGILRGGVFVFVYLVCSIVILQWNNLNTVELLTFSNEKTGAKSVVIISNVQADILNIQSDDFSSYELVTYLRQRGVVNVNKYVDFDYDTKAIGSDTDYLINALKVKDIYYGRSNEEYDLKDTEHHKYTKYEKVATKLYGSQEFELGKNVRYDIYSLSGDHIDYSIVLEIFDLGVSIIPELFEENREDLIIVYKNATNMEQRLEAPVVITYDGVNIDKSVQNIVYDSTDNYRIVFDKAGMEIKERLIK